MTSASRNEPGTQRFHSLDALRGVAVMMVVYDHLFALHGERLTGKPFAPAEFIRNYFSAPAGIIQDFGWLGVCIFFLVSGFVIAKSAIEETSRAFAIRRFMRIFPPFAATIMLVMGIDALTTGLRPLENYLLALTLVGYVTIPQVIVVGVAWTLAIEVVFYVAIFFAAPLLKGKRAAAGVLMLSGFVMLVLAMARMHGDSFFLFAATVAYVPLLILGVIGYLWHSGRSGHYESLLLALANLVIFMYGLSQIHTAFYKAENSYLVSVFYALAIFWLSVRLREAPPVLKFLGDISYSLYLLHGILGAIVLKWIVPVLAVSMRPLAPIVATAVSIAASYAMYIWIERPSIAKARAMTTSESTS